MNAGRIEEAIDEMEKAVALKPDFADLRFSLGSLHVDASRFDEAKKHFEHALRINPRFFKAKINLARALFNSGDGEQAAATVKAAKDGCPNFYKDNLDNLIQMVQMDEDRDAIEQAFHEILEDRPSSAQVRREIAIEAIQNGDYPEAIRELKKSLAVNPDYPDILRMNGKRTGMLMIQNQE